MCEKHDDNIGMRDEKKALSLTKPLPILSGSNISKTSSDKSLCESNNALNLAKNKITLEEKRYTELRNKPTLEEKRKTSLQSQTLEDKKRKRFDQAMTLEEKRKLHIENRMTIEEKRKLQTRNKSEEVKVYTTFNYLITLFIFILFIVCICLSIYFLMFV